MASIKLILAAITITIMLSVCEGKVLEDWLRHFFEEDTGKRSLSQAITDYLDLIFPKDDKESRVMKEIFTILSDGYNMFTSENLGLDYLMTE